MIKNNYYQGLKPYTDLAELIKNGQTVSIPQDQYVVLTDIIKSTEAIKQGKYKEVNAINAAIISAVLDINEENYKLIPFSFGGDGAMMVISEDLRQATIEHLAQAKLLARDLGLQIRCSIIPIKDLYDAGFDLSLGKLEVSDKFVQAIFLGQGSEVVESWAKSSDKYEVLTKDIMKGVTLKASGFTCRWEPIKSSRGKSLSIIIKSRIGDSQYSQILETIKEIFGSNEDLNPLSIEDMKLSLKPQTLGLDAKLNVSSKIGRIQKLIRIYAENLLGITMATPKIKENVETKKNNNFLHSDFIKLDGSLKMTISADDKQIQKFEKYLQNEYVKQNIYYGLFVNTASLITCLVFPNNQFEVHFVDGSDGGYAMASQEMKKQVLN